MEIFTWIRLGGSMAQIVVVPVCDDTSRESHEGAIRQVLQDLASFDVSQVTLPRPLTVPLLAPFYTPMPPLIHLLAFCTCSSGHAGPARPASYALVAPTTPLLPPSPAFPRAMIRRLLAHASSLPVAGHTSARSCTP